MYISSYLVKRATDEVVAAIENAVEAAPEVATKPNVADNIPGVADKAKKLTSNLLGTILDGKGIYKNIRQGVTFLSKNPWARRMGILGLPGLGFLVDRGIRLSKDQDSLLDAIGLGDASDEHKNLALLAAVAAPVLGAVGGSTSGTGLLHGAATGAGALGGAYAGFKGSQTVMDLLKDNDLLDAVPDDWRGPARLLAMLGGTAAGGVAGAGLMDKLVPGKKEDNSLDNTEIE
jgi:hypothetical protein